MRYIGQFVNLVFVSFYKIYFQERFMDVIPIKATNFNPKHLRLIQKEVLFCILHNEFRGNFVNDLRL